MGPLTLGMQYYGGQPFRQDWPGKARLAAKQKKTDALAANAQNALSDLQQNISYAIAYSPQGSSPYGQPTSAQLHMQKLLDLLSTPAPSLLAVHPSGH